MGMSDNNCPLCLKTKMRYLFSAEDRLLDGNGRYPVLFCGHCQLGYSDIKQGPDYFNKAYPDEYFTGVLRLDDDTDMAAQVKLILAVGEIRGKKILEVGSAGGGLLSALAGRGAEVFGVEPAQYARKIALSKGLKVFSAIEEIKDRDFDIAVLFDALEHAFEPLTLLAQIRTRLKPAGTVILSLPNFTSFEARILKGRWFALELPRHIFHFSPRSIGLLAGASGMELKKMQFPMSSFITKSFFDPRLKTKNRLNGLAAVSRPMEALFYLFGNRPYMVAYLAKGTNGRND